MNAAIDGFRPERTGSAPIGPEAGAALTAKVVAVMSALQTTLEVEGLIRLFCRTIRDSVPHDGMRYVHAGEGVDTAWGVQEGELLNCRLTLEGRPLGELTLFGRHPLGARTLALLDHFTGFLLHPLRNALAHRRLAHSAARDPLTGAGNRRAMEGALARKLALSGRDGSDFSLLVLDIDHFKAINDRNGHAVGDRALKSLVARIHHELRCDDTLYRFGGEEFVVLLDNTGLDGARRVAERLRLAIAVSPHRFAGGALALTVSVGVAQWHPKEAGEALFRRADEALYRAKREGRNRVCAD